MRVTVESCSQIKILDLQKSIKKKLATDYPDITSEQQQEITLNELKKFTVNGQTFEYSCQPSHLGGVRWFFLCPKCGHNAYKLVLPPPLSDRERLYLCKECHKLKNQSALMGQSTMYQMVTRPMKRLKQIEDKIAVGHLGRDRVKDLLDEYDRIEEELKSSPEYRLYMFKKNHGLLPQ